MFSSVACAYGGAGCSDTRRNSSKTASRSAPGWSSASPRWTVAGGQLAGGATVAAYALPQQRRTFASTSPAVGASEASANAFVMRTRVAAAASASVPRARAHRAPGEPSRRAALVDLGHGQQHRVGGARGSEVHGLRIPEATVLPSALSGGQARCAPPVASAMSAWRRWYSRMPG